MDILNSIIYSNVFQKHCQMKKQYFGSDVRLETESMVNYSKFDQEWLSLEGEMMIYVNQMFTSGEPHLYLKIWYRFLID